MSEGPIELPEILVHLLDGTALRDKVGETLVLLSVAPDGFPHLALLSVGEVFAPHPKEVRMALWPNSTTTANLTRTGMGTLAYVAPSAAIYVELEATRVLHPGLALFVATLRSIRIDHVGYAELVCGIRFRLNDPAAVVARWQATIDRLRVL